MRRGWRDLGSDHRAPLSRASQRHLRDGASVELPGCAACIPARNRCRQIDRGCEFDVIGESLVDELSSAHTTAHSGAGFARALAIPSLDRLVEQVSLPNHAEGIASQSDSGPLLLSMSPERLQNLIRAIVLQLARIAAEFGICHGEKWELWVLLAGFEALRLGESLAVTGDQFSWVKGQWRYNASVQEYRAVAADSDDGKTTKVSTKTKSTRSNTPPPRNAPVPRHLGMRLEKCFGERLGTSTEHLFVGPRGGIANHETVREWWNAIVRRLYGDHPTLSAMTPHVLRHAGMTFWFAAPNAEQKLIQQWGGWQSLKEMLDTYRGVIDALEVEATSSIDEFHQRWLPEPDSDPLEVLSPNARSGNVYDLNARRMRRPDATGSTGS